MSVNEDPNVLVKGQWIFQRKPTMPSGGITNADIAASAGIDASKLQHQHSLNHELFGPATTITALTKVFYICRGSNAVVVQVEAAIYVAADDASRTVHVDVQKSTAGGAFSTVMSATVSITNGTAIFTPVEGTVNATPAAMVDGDILQFVVTVAGGSGNQAKGLTASVTIREDAD